MFSLLGNVFTSDVWNLNIELFSIFQLKYHTNIHKAIDWQRTNQTVSDLKRGRSFCFYQKWSSFVKSKRIWQFYTSNKINPIHIFYLFDSIGAVFSNRHWLWLHSLHTSFMWPWLSKISYTPCTWVRHHFSFLWLLHVPFSTQPYCSIWSNIWK